MTYRIPQKGVIRQLNKGDLAGELYSTKNVDFRTNPGRIRVSPRLTLAVKDNDSAISNMGVPVAFTYDGITDRYWVATGIGTGTATSGTGTIVKSDDTDFTSDWDNDAEGNTPTDIHLGFSDMIMWPGTSSSVLARTPIVTTYGSSTSKIKRFKNTTDDWDAAYHTTVAYTFNVGGGIKNLCEGFNGNLYMTDDDQINHITPAGAGVQSGAGTIDFNGRYRAIWIRSSSNKLWIGLMSYDAQEGSKGFVAEWRGTGTAANYIYGIDDSCPLSCVILDDVPYIVTGRGVIKKYRGEGAGFSEVARLPVANTNIEMPGIYDDLNNSRWVHHRGMDVSDGKILINVNNYVSSGVYVEDMPSGVWEFDPQSGSLHHRNSPCAASTDFGQQFISTAGAVFGTKRTEGNYLAGFGYYTDGSTERKGIFYDDVVTNSSKIGGFTTTFLSSEGIEDAWQRLYYRHFPLPTSDKIIAKKRTRKNANYPVLIDLTWSSTTQFTSTTAGMANVEVGDEVVIMQGIGASKSSHITVISSNGGTYTVTLDETYTSASGTAKAYIWNFKKISFNETDSDVLSDFPLNDHDHQTQIKTDVWATDDMEIHDLTVVNKGHKLI